MSPGAGPWSPRAAGLVGVAVVVALLIGGCGGGAKRGFAFGGFGGYVWSGQVRSVAASWAVPTIAGDSSTGRASTWVGAQAPPTALSASFIQVGTTEERLSFPQGPQNGYIAFWSDDEHGFRPQGLFAVEPGDEISASLTLRHRRWTVQIVDATSGKRSRFSTGGEARASFNRGEWMQERTAQTRDPAGKLYPYPNLSTVRFRDLAVNSASPSDADLASQWMSIGTGFLGPTPLQDDSFVLARQTISPPARRYLAIVNAAVPGVNAFIDQLKRWTATTARSRIASATAAFARVERSNIDALAAGRWPQAAQPLVEANIREKQREIAQARSAVTASTLPAWRTTMLNDLESSRRTIHLLRRALDLPDVNLNLR